MRRLLLILLVGLFGIPLAGCGGKDKVKIPQLPLTTAFDRTSHKIGKVDLVVHDRERAATVKSIYQDIELMLISTRIKQDAQRAKSLSARGPDENVTTEEIRRGFEVVVKTGKAAFKQYIELQLELRRHLTEKEFKKLDKVR